MQNQTGAKSETFNRAFVISLVDLEMQIQMATLSQQILSQSSAAGDLGEDWDQCQYCSSQTLMCVGHLKIPVGVGGKPVTELFAAKLLLNHLTG